MSVCTCRAHNDAPEAMHEDTCELAAYELAQFTGDLADPDDDPFQVGA